MQVESELLAALRKKLGPLTLEEIVSLVETSSGEPSVKTISVPLPSWRRGASRNGVLATSADGSVGLPNAAGGTLRGQSSNNTSVTDTGQIELALPQNYVAGGEISFIFRANVGILRQVANTIGLSVKKVGDNAVGSELCVTNPQVLTVDFADYSFVVTPTDLVAGDILALILTLTNNDTGGSGGAAVINVAKTSYNFLGM